MAGLGVITTPHRLHLSIDASQQSQQWTDWIAELELYFTADNITADKRKYALLLYLGGSEIRDIYNTLEDENKTFSSARELLNKYFVDKKNLVFERYQFNSLQQKSEESAKAFLVRLKKVGMSCDFASYTLEDAIIDKFIAGCRDNSLRKKLLSSKELNFETLVEKAISSEIVDKQASIMERQGGNTGGDICAIYEDSGEDLCALTTVQCFGCGEPGHIIHDAKCPASRQSCRKCGFIGHFQKYCRKHDNKGAKKPIHAVEVNDSEGKYLF